MSKSEIKQNGLKNLPISFKTLLNNAPEEKCDLVDGNIILSSPVSVEHNQMRSFIESLLRIYIEEKRLGKIFSENFPVMLNDNNWREPDILFISTNRLYQLEENIFTGTPNLIIEIISPESKYRDEVRKKAEYETLGVEEYWLIFPQKFEESSFYQLKNAKYEKNVFQSEKITSTEIKGFFLKKKWLWGESKLPTVLATIKDFDI